MTKLYVDPLFGNSVWIGYLIAGSFICLTGRIGAVYHIGFPVVARSSFGIWGNLWPVLNRAAMVKSPSCSSKHSYESAFAERRIMGKMFLGLHLVWGADMDGRDMHIFDDSVHLAVIRDTP